MTTELHRWLRAETNRTCLEKSISNFMAMPPEERHEFVKAINKIYRRKVMKFDTDARSDSS